MAPGYQSLNVFLVVIARSRRLLAPGLVEPQPPNETKLLNAYPLLEVVGKKQSLGGEIFNETNQMNQRHESTSPGEILG
jgi:hypothetical protein